MNSFTVYPAIDLAGGKVVRLRQGKRDQQTNYSNSPSEVARNWIDQGSQWIHVVNLDGAFGEKSSANQSAIQSILKQGDKKVKIQLGGGLRTIEQIDVFLKMGVSRVVLGTAVIENPEFGEKILDKFGGKNVAFGFDALDGELMSRGWQSPSGMELKPLGKRLAGAGAETLIYTNILKDGMQTGVDWEIAKGLADYTGLDIIASGGTTNLADVKAVCNAELAGVIIGRALYEGNFSLEEAINVC
jgi:phosphoribosylformimino-5-aminoimidazole carboxamide ribotide isomerase